MTSISEGQSTKTRPFFNQNQGPHLGSRYRLVNRGSILEKKTWPSLLSMKYWLFNDGILVMGFLSLL